MPALEGDEKNVCERMFGSQAVCRRHGAANDGGGLNTSAGVPTSQTPCSTDSTTIGRPAARPCRAPACGEEAPPVVVGAAASHLQGAVRLPRH